MVQTVLVTGGAGYIGSHAVLSLRDSGRRVVVLDDLSSGFAAAVPNDVTLVRGDIADRRLVGRILRRFGISSVMHFAGSLSVPESVSEPGAYYRNNTTGTLHLAQACIAAGVGAFIFSSTAAVYGDPERVPTDEASAKRPCSPYGWSKLMAEQILRDLSIAHPGFRPVRLRYFNVAGADPLGRAGQRNPHSGALIKRAIEVALGARERLEIFGGDYPTPDGSCVRDYIHVSDLARAHVAALDYLAAGGAPVALNCGYGHGYSVFDVVRAVETVIGRPLPQTLSPRRPGDPAIEVADTSRLRRTLDWAPQHDRLEAIIASALNWADTQARHARSQAVTEDGAAGLARRRDPQSLRRLTTMPAS